MDLNKIPYRKIVDNLYDGLYIVNKERVIQYWNKAAERISGFTAAEVIGKSCADKILTHVDKEGHDLCGGLCPLVFTVTEGQVCEAEVFLHHKEGHRVPVFVRTAPLIGKDNSIIGAVELFTDMSNFKADELRIKELEEMALLDNLTRLANRNHIERELTMRLEESKRFNVRFGIIFLDIDHFKKVNDTYGHDMGDRVLKFVADTLAKNIRPFDLVGRWGGEEFIAIIRNANENVLIELSNRLRMLVEKSYIVLADDKLNVTISIGTTIVRGDDDINSIIKRADELLYQSKRAGRNRLTFG
ncbi:MAG TPA: GGDEF domain-containing protein [Smithellaceae bacterium]|nr:GGDEF domain-containing protein [Smithellaceae bacterium]HRS88561.1 GGDEF domain-containing protein [Smithellaceae bacterium]HRV25315.1 GGDEF domain-containing protein [Smithellaceae bacterium]